MNLPDKPQPSSNESLTVQKSASIFRNILAVVLSEESPFNNAPFITKIAEKYLEDKNQETYFTSQGGFGSNIIFNKGIATPIIDLNIQEGLKSRNLRQRVAFRLGKENPSDEEIFQFATGHELGHLIQGLADYTSIEDQDIEGKTEIQIDELKRAVDVHNNNVRTNKDVKDAQDYFRLIFVEDVNRDFNEAYINAGNYTNEEYLNYVNSSTESNADFISLWIMGMNNPNMKTLPQNEGYSLKDWKKWAEDHKIEAIHLA